MPQRLPLATLVQLGVDAAQGLLVGLPDEPWPVPGDHLLAAVA